MVNLKLSMMEMKKLLLMTFAVVALASCSKEEATKIEGDHFVAGQKVTLFASSPNAGTKVSSELAEDGKTINFKWDEGDEILVTVGEASSTFTLVDGAGTSVGKFEGEMPAEGNTFSVQYPVAGDPIKTTQEYNDKGIPDGNMLFTTTNGTISGDKGSFELSPANSALRLNLYGANVTVKSIKVTIGTDVYTLDCGDGVQIGATKADSTAFRLVVPAQTSTFSVNVTANATTIKSYPTYGDGTAIITGTTITAGSNEFKAGKTLNMPAKQILAVVWAPVNCGYVNDSETDRRWGRYYQFGRYAGQLYNTTNTSSATTTGKMTTPDNYTFYINNTGTRDWYTTKQSNQLPKWPQINGDTGFVSEKLANPCPNDWRVPTATELSALLCPTDGVNKNIKKSQAVHGKTTLWGCWFDGTSNPPIVGTVGTTHGVFLPIGSYISASGETISDSSNYRRSYSLNYWSSDVSGQNGRYLNVIFDDGESPSKKDGKDYYSKYWTPSGEAQRTPKMTSTARACAFTIRCVQK